MSAFASAFQRTEPNTEMKTTLPLLLLLFVGPALGLIAQALPVPQGYEIVTAWMQYGPLGLTAITAIIVAALLVRNTSTQSREAGARLDAVNLAHAARIDEQNRTFVARLDAYQSAWMASVERITREHNETMKQVTDELRDTVLENTAELSKSTETRGEANQTIVRLQQIAVCPYANRIEDHPAFKMK